MASNRPGSLCNCAVCQNACPNNMHWDDTHHRVKYVLYGERGICADCARSIHRARPTPAHDTPNVPDDRLATKHIGGLTA